jgi:zinc transporter ZupT
MAFGAVVSLVRETNINTLHRVLLAKSSMEATLATGAPRVVKAAMAPNGMDALDWTPLYMSGIAGMSTCLGAVWVFFQRPPAEKDGSRRVNSPRSVISPSTMSFSLALAGSVMVTVSVVSIIPECLKLDIYPPTDDSYHMIPIMSTAFLHRVVFHVAGYVLYFLLAKFAFPEPDEILGLSTKSDEEKGELVALTESSPSDHSSSQQHFDVESAGETKRASSPGTARNRRMKERRQQSGVNDVKQIEITSRSSGGGSTSLRAHMERGMSSNMTGSDESETNEEEAENKKPDCMRTLSRYSSGADLESSESKRAWRVAMLLFLSLAVHNFPEGLGENFYCV